MDRRYALLHHARGIPRPLMDYVIRTDMIPLAWGADTLIQSSPLGMQALLSDTASSARDAPLLAGPAASFFETHGKLRVAGVDAFVQGWSADLTVAEMHVLAAGCGLLGLGHPWAPTAVRRHLVFEDELDEEDELTLPAKVPRLDGTNKENQERPRGMPLNTDRKRKQRKH